MAVSDADRLRKLLGESVPEAGSASDTLFTDEEVTDLLARYDSVEGALSEAWAMKAGALSNLVDVTEGDAKRMLSQSARQALEMSKHFGASASATLGSGTTIHRIEREGWQG